MTPLPAATQLERLPRRGRSCQVPQPLGDGRFEVDATWGSVQPILPAPGVRTVGELELIEHVRQGRPVIDTRLAHFLRGGTIPGARSIPHGQILEHLDELDPSVPTVFFCNGPQCAATPDAIRTLLDAGYPPAAILYYRGGMHDWITLGYPTVPGRPGSQSSVSISQNARPANWR
jgi:rhodanese-related sulfurtransferase